MKDELKVLHSGDLHLGMTFNSRGYPDLVREALVNARLAALDSLVEIANNNQCQLFVISGDLFNRINVSEALVLETVKILQRFAGGCVAVLPGNHDYFDEAGGLWGYFHKVMPDNTLLLTNARPYSLHGYDIDAVLYPAPCDARHSASNRLDWITRLKEKPQARWHLGIGHGTVPGVSADPNGQYFPMTEHDLNRCGLDLWLMGHAHVPYPQEDDVRGHSWQYCGVPEPDGFDCSGYGQAWLVTLNDAHVVSTSVKCGSFRFQALDVEIRSIDELQSHVDSILKDGADNMLVRLSVSGLLPEDEYRGRLQVYRRLQEAVFYLEVDEEGLEIEITGRVIDEQFTAGSFPSRLLSKLHDDGNREALQLAYQIIKKVKQ